MAKEDLVKKALLEARSLQDAGRLFELLGFAVQDLGEYIAVEMEPGVDLEIHGFLDRKELDQELKRNIPGRCGILGVSQDLETWIFLRRGLQRNLRYRIQRAALRESERPVAAQRIAALKPGKLESFEELFERRDISRRFYRDYSRLRNELAAAISNLKEKDKELERANRRLFAQVLLDRLIFLFFLQKKLLLAGDPRYLISRFKEHGQGKSGYFRNFLQPLFFEGLCKEPAARSAATETLLGGAVPYLNGGLFLLHRVEETYPDADIKNAVFADILAFFESWNWSVDERADTDQDAIDPYILGYIFENSLGENKSQGVYYTPPFLSEFLTRETLHAHLLHIARGCGAPPDCTSAVEFLNTAPVAMCAAFYDRLRELRILDPACGSGQFLVEALAELSEFHEILARLAHNQPELHQLIQEDYDPLRPGHIYAIRRFITANNLYGVDLLPEAAEITKLRLFLGMVQGISAGADLEPLPNIDFHIRAGDSLSGYLSLPDGVDALEGEQIALNFTRAQDRFQEREKLIFAYTNEKDPARALELRHEIDAATQKLRVTLNLRLDQDLAQWGVKPKAKIDFIDEKKDAGARKFLQSFRLQAEELQPCHWIMEFSEALDASDPAERGFDIVLMNPPWEIWKPNSQEFFEERIAGFRELDKNDARKAVAALFKKDPEAARAWMEHCARISAFADFVRLSGFYPARGQGDINLYKLFLERGYQLLKPDGALGIVMPSGFYSDLGARELRALFLQQSVIEFLYGFENSNAIFDNVHRSYKFVIFCARRTPTPSKGTLVPAAFMLRSAEDLHAAHGRAAGSRHVTLSLELIRRLSPESLALLEFKSLLDIQIVQKLAHAPRLGEENQPDSSHTLSRELDSALDAHLFRRSTELGFTEILSRDTYGRINIHETIWQPLYEGRMIGAYDSAAASFESGARRSSVWKYNNFPKDSAFVIPQYWVNPIPAMANEANYKVYLCRITGTTNRRTSVAALVPIQSIASDSLTAIRTNTTKEAVWLLIMLNSFCVDFFVRQRMAGNNFNNAAIYDLPVPRFQSAADHPYFTDLVQKAAQLSGTTAAYDELLREVFGKKASHKSHGVTDPVARQQLKNEIDARVARIYDLSEAELAHILSTFPLVEADIKAGVLEEFRKLG